MSKTSEKIFIEEEYSHQVGISDDYIKVKQITRSSKSRHRSRDKSREKSREKSVKKH